MNRSSIQSRESACTQPHARTRVLSIFLAIVLVVGFLPQISLGTTPALADEGALQAGSSSLFGGSLSPSDVITGDQPANGSIVGLENLGVSQEKQFINLTQNPIVTLPVQFIADTSAPAGAQEAFNNLPAADKYAASCFTVHSSNLDCLGITYRFNSSTGEPNLEYDAKSAGLSEVVIEYKYQNYSAFTHSFVWVLDGNNPATSIKAPSTELTLWTAPSGSSLTTYYYDYPFDESFYQKGITTGPHYAEDSMYQIAVGTQQEDAPCSFGPSDIFTTTMSDPSVLSLVDIHSYGQNQLTYAVNMTGLKAGTTNVTFALKSNPAQSVTVKVNVRTAPPSVLASNFDMEVGSSKRIYAQGNMSANAAPVSIEKQVAYLYGRVDAFSGSSVKNPYITDAVSSDDSVVAIQPIASPNSDTRYCPYDFVALAEGTATITLTDHYGNDTSFDITVTPVSGDANPEAVTDLTLDQTEIEMQTIDLAGVQLTPTVVASDGNTHAVKWRSSDPAIASVDDNGLVVPHAAGECIITAAAGSKAASCTVVVTSATICTSDPNSPLGEVSIKLPYAPSQAILDELQNLTLSVSTIAPGSNSVIDGALSDMASEGKEVYGVYDIHFNDASGAEHAWNKPDFPINVCVPLTADMREKNARGQLAFYYVNDATGERTKMNSWVDDSFVYFETTHFSPFALALESNAGEGGAGTTAGTGAGGALPATGDSTLAYAGLIGVIALLAVLALGTLYVARRRMDNLSE